MSNSSPPLHAVALTEIARLIDDQVLMTCLEVAIAESEKDGTHPRQQLVLGLIQGMEAVQQHGTLSAERVRTLLTILACIAVLDRHPFEPDTAAPPIVPKHHQPPNQN